MSPKIRQNKKASANTRKSGVSTKKVDRLRELSKTDKTFNQAQKTMVKEKLSFRRQTMQTYWREFKNKPAPTNPSKHVPRKYRGTTAQKSWRRRQRDWRRGRVREKPEDWWRNKRVVLQGTVNGERVQETRSGSGKELYDFVKDEMKNGPWDRRPTITS